MYYMYVRKLENQVKHHKLSTQHTPAGTWGFTKSSLNSGRVACVCARMYMYMCVCVLRVHVFGVCMSTCAKFKYGLATSFQDN